MMSDRAKTLSASEYLLGEQCSLALWRSENAPDLKDPEDSEEQNRIKDGQEVHDFARNLYRDNVVEIFHNSLTHEEADAETAVAMEDPFVDVIYEATFLIDGRPFRVDILRRDGQGGWEVVEIKSSSSVKPEHEKQVAFQVHALRQVTDISRAYVAHIDKGFVYDGETIDPWELFRFQDVTAEVDNMRSEIETHTAQRKRIKSLPQAPVVDVKVQPCNKPHTCPFYGACHDNLPKLNGIKDSIKDMNLRPGTTKFNLLNEAGIDRISQIPEDLTTLLPEEEQENLTKTKRKKYELSKYQMLQWKATVTGEPQVDAGKVEEALAHLAGGFHNYDIEWVSFAIPRYPGTSPYEEIPMQASCSTILPDGSYQWRDWIWDGEGDPFRAFAEWGIIDLLRHDDLPIIHYHNPEPRKTMAMAERFPELAETLDHINTRYTDLLRVQKDTNTYLPEYQGSYSEKYVLPAHVPGFGHGDLEITDGMLASRWLAALTNPGLDPDTRRAIVQNLRMYNKRDTDGTLALVLAQSRLVQELVARRHPEILEHGVTNAVVRGIVDGQAPRMAMAR